MCVSLTYQLKQTKMENLTKKQKEEFDILVRLGDSKELALKTVLSTGKKNQSKMYYKAYCL